MLIWDNNNNNHNNHIDNNNNNSNTNMSNGVKYVIKLFKTV